MLKKLYSFTIPKLTEVEESTETDEGKLIKKVTKEVDQPFFIARPTREELEEGEIFYTQKLHEYCRAGIMQEIILRKMYGNENGIFTEDEKKNYVELFIKLGSNLSKIKELEDKKELDEDEKKVVADLYLENKKLQKSIGEYENAKQSVFDNSAESMARSKTVFWWLLKLSYNGDETPLFPGENHVERAKAFDAVNDKIEEDNEDGKFYSKLIERASFLVSLFYLNGTVKPTEFTKLVESFDNEIKD